MNWQGQLLKRYISLPDFADKVADCFRKLRSEQQRVIRWQKYSQSLIPYEQRFIEALRGTKDRPGFFRQQKEEVLANMGVKRVKVVEDWLFDQRKYELLFEEFGQLLLPEIVHDRGREELERLGVGVAFDVNNPRVSDFLGEKVYKFSFETNNTTIKHLRREFANGLADGEGIPVLAKRVEKVFDFAEKYRSVRIARTEVLGSSNFGALESYKQSGVVELKEWLATKDSSVRDSHAAIDGQQVPLLGRFSNGLQHPGDPSGSAEEVINCRCALIPVVKE